MTEGSQNGNMYTAENLRGENLGSAVTLTLLERITLLLAQLAASQERIEGYLKQEKQRQIELGFGEPPRVRYIYCNRSNNCLWYWINDSREVVPIPKAALTGYVEKLEFKQVERRGKDTWKLHLHIRADRRYVLEAGYDSNFSKSLISALAAITPQQLQQPITIEVQAAESDEVLFCRVYANGELVFAPWDEGTVWKVVAKQAISKVGQAQMNQF
jgi:6-phosphogluconolactonase (cycloisomerase 2 family)